MSQNNTHAESHSHSHEIQKSLNMAFWINFIFAIIEIIGGIYANSSAVLADAVHDFGDSLAILIGIKLEKESHKKPNPQYTFGYKRLTVLSSLVTGVILISGSLLTFKEGIVRLFQPQSVNTTVMVGLALLGIFANMLGVIKTLGKRNQNEKIINLHLMEDLLGWFAVLLGAVIIRFTGWYILDGLLAMMVSCYTIYHAIGIITDNISIFLNATEKNTVDIRSELLTVQGVKDIHDMHIWTNSDQHDDNLSAHVLVQGYNQLDIIKTKIKSVLDSHHIHHVTLEFEMHRCETDCNGKLNQIMV